jgi:septum formation protein
MKLPMIYLASASPRRREILLQIGIAHEVLQVPAPEGEDEPQFSGEAPDIYVRRTARDKAVRAAAWLASGTAGLPSPNTYPILAADTTVILDGLVLGKPADHADAERMLAGLSGNTHYVHTAVVVAHQDQIFEDVSVTEVRFATLSSKDIQAYVKTGEPMGKAGAYGIQGRAALFIAHICGSYTGVMGLPAFETGRLLRSVSHAPS